MLPNFFATRSTPVISPSRLKYGCFVAASIFACSELLLVIILPQFLLVYKLRKLTPQNFQPKQIEKNFFNIFAFLL